MSEGKASNPRDLSFENLLRFAHAEGTALRVSFRPASVVVRFKVKKTGEDIRREFSRAEVPDQYFERKSLDPLTGGMAPASSHLLHRRDRRESVAQEGSQSKALTVDSEEKKKLDEKASEADKKEDEKKSIERQEADTINELRQNLGPRTLLFAFFWLSNVFAITYLVGCGTNVELVVGDRVIRFIDRGFHLSDGIVIGLISSTGVLGLVAIILNGLFPGSKRGKSEAK